MAAKRRAKPRYEGSPEDLREDVRGAERLKLSLRDYERTARDKREDAAGQRKRRK